MIPALVLTAGLATRLRPLSFVRAKAALPVAGDALARRVLRRLAAAGVTDAVLNLHHLPHTLTSLVGDGSDLGLRVRYSWEVPVLGSAGGPKRALPLLGDRFLVVNGDTLTDVDVAALVRAHQQSGALVTMAVVPNAEPEKYGGVIADEDDRAAGFVSRGSPQPSFHFIGTQVADAEAFASVPADTPYESVAALYPALIAQRRDSVRIYRTHAEFLDIGTPADYLDTSLLMAGREGRDPAGSRVRLERAAVVQRSILWDDVTIESGAFLRECVVTDGVRVPADTSWDGVTMRRAEGDLAPGERRIGDLAVGPL
jgi:NDP-sugar pyrophosphorylase family protein